MKNPFKKNSMAFPLSVLFLLLTTSCSPSKNTKKAQQEDAENAEVPMDCSAGEFTKWSILGGKTVHANSPIARSVVYIKIQIGESIAQCTSTLIGPDVLLTAAHCVISPRGLLAEAGTAYFSTNPACDKKANRLVSIGFKKIISNEKYSNSKMNSEDDVALILLERSAPSDYQPMVVENQNLTSFEMNNVYITGFGKSEGYQITDRNQSRLKISSINVQSKLDFSKISMTEGKSYYQLAQPEGGVCAGDSGGPLIVIKNDRPVIIGVASTVLGSKKNQEPCKGISRFCDISGQRDWIQDQLSKLNRALP